MTEPRHIAVIDIGKTNAKLALVDRATLTETAVVTRPNTVRDGPPWPHFDVDGHWRFLLNALSRFHRDHGVDAISVTTHGACAILLNRDGGLAAPVLDYEHDGPADTAALYDAIRPPFGETGSPRLANGLNLGAQLHWQFTHDPALLARTAHIVTYPQYWGQRLTGQIACDVTSLGCHTDLWCPGDGTFSNIVRALGIDAKIAPVRKPTDILGPILPAVARATGLPPGTPVAVGIHDSNASLYPHMLGQSGPFSVVSTGTWVVVMAIGGTAPPLDPDRDTLINVNAHCQPVPSARFMGGREFERLQGGQAALATPHDIAEVLNKSRMILPAVEPHSGPFPGQQMRWTGDAPSPATGQHAAAVAFYLAMMTDTCLRLTGATGPVIVEGPFAQNAPYMAMLAAATTRPVLHSANATGTSIGAALLFGDTAGLARPLPAAHGPVPPGMQAYATVWRRRVAQGSI